MQHHQQFAGKSTTYAPVLPVEGGASPLDLSSRRAQKTVKPWQRAVKLEPRHYVAAEYVAKGLRDKEIAFRMGLTPGSVRVYISELFRLTGCNNRVALAQWSDEQKGRVRFSGAILTAASGEFRIGAFE